MKYSIVIPTYNHLDDCLRPCLESIIKYTDLTNVEVIVVANGCKDGTRAYVESLPSGNFKLLWFNEGIGYTKATNEGIKVAKGEFIVLLNNDTVLLEQQKSTWLDLLVAPFEDPKVAITGPMQNFCDAAIRDFLIFFCVMVRASVVKEIGLLDEIFSPGYGEDTDWCCRAVDAGYRMVQVPKPGRFRLTANDKIGTGDFPFYHAGNTTFANYPGGTEILLKNRKILSERYANKDIDLTRAMKCSGFMTDSELRWLAEQARRARVIIEVGSWHGKSTRTLADHLPPDGKLYAIDHWNGSQNEPEWHGSAKEMSGDHAFYEFSKNLFDLMQSGKVVPLRMHSSNAAKFLKEQGISADFVFIDGGHTYEEVKRDIAEWLPLVREGGIVCGHDYAPGAWPGVIQAVNECFGAERVGVAKDTSIWVTDAIPAGLARLQIPAVSRPRLVYDGFIFFNELDILEIRLNELDPVVDKFVLVESRQTHQGAPKALYFEESRRQKRFKRFESKIIHVVVESFPEGSDVWARERFQRDAIMQGFNDCVDSDLVMISDVDEIPRAAAIQAYNPEIGLATFSQNLYYYYLNCYCQEWLWGKILPWRLMKGMSPCQVRYTEGAILPNGGWHFSFMGGVRQIVHKIESYAHHEYNRPDIKDEKRIAEIVEKGQDVFGRPMQYRFVQIDETYPQFVRQHYDRLHKIGLIK